MQRPQQQPPRPNGQQPSRQSMQQGPRSNAQPRTVHQLKEAVLVELVLSMVNWPFCVAMPHQVYHSWNRKPCSFSAQQFSSRWTVSCAASFDSLFDLGPGWRGVPCLAESFSAESKIHSFSCQIPMRPCCGQVFKNWHSQKTGLDQFCRFYRKPTKSVENRYKIRNQNFGLKKSKIDQFCQKPDDFSGLSNDFSKNRWFS
jgi:hypothetical protein